MQVQFVRIRSVFGVLSVQFLPGSPSSPRSHEHSCPRARHVDRPGSMHVCKPSASPRFPRYCPYSRPMGVAPRFLSPTPHLVNARVTPFSKPCARAATLPMTSPLHCVHGCPFAAASLGLHSSTVGGVRAVADSAANRLDLGWVLAAVLRVRSKVD